MKFLFVNYMLISIIYLSLSVITSIYYIHYLFILCIVHVILNLLHYFIVIKFHLLVFLSKKKKNNRHIFIDRYNMHV